MYEETTEKLLEFISKSPTAFQAAEETRRRFLEEGFTELKEEERWELEKAMELYKFCHEKSFRDHRFFHSCQ
mgnify:CR=1 FL=1